MLWFLKDEEMKTQKTSTKEDPSHMLYNQATLRIKQQPQYNDFNARVNIALTVMTPIIKTK